MALTLTETFHFSFAYSAKALRAASWMNFDTGVMRLSSFSIGAGPWAELRAGTISASSAARTAMTRTMNASLEYRLRFDPAAGPLDGPAPACIARRASFCVRRRRKAALEAPAAREVSRLPQPGAHSREERGAHRRGLGNRGAKHLDV